MKAKQNAGEYFASRKLAERVILSAVQDKLCSADNLQYLLRRVEQEVYDLNRDLPETIKLKQAEQLCRRDSSQKWRFAKQCPDPDLR